MAWCAWSTKYQCMLILRSLRIFPKLCLNLWAIKATQYKSNSLLDLVDILWRSTGSKNSSTVPSKGLIRHFYALVRDSGFRPIWCISSSLVKLSDGRAIICYVTSRVSLFWCLPLLGFGKWNNHLAVGFACLQFDYFHIILLPLLHCLDKQQRSISSRSNVLKYREVVESLEDKRFSRQISSNCEEHWLNEGSGSIAVSVSLDCI
jgi:hypothetical protein